MEKSDSERSGPPTELTSSTTFKVPSNDTQGAAANANCRLTLDYKPPPWAIEIANETRYSLEVIKNGIIVEEKRLNDCKSPTYMLAGREERCDLRLSEKNVSRYHLVLQYGEDSINRSGKGWYLYDLGSTHGTKLNKCRVEPKKFIRVNVGYVMQFGETDCIMTLNGPAEDVESEWEHSPTEMKQKIMKKKKEKSSEKSPDSHSTLPEDVEENCTWGMAFDEELAYTQIKDATDGEEKYRNDPLKALSRFFEREGFTMEFEFEQTKMGRTHGWNCIINLPVQNARDQSLSASASNDDKKEAKITCALRACHILDMHGLLFPSLNATKKKAKDLAENDFYDSDEDTYLDRTGQIEKNRENRRNRAIGFQRDNYEKETYDSLKTKISKVEQEILQVKEALTKLYEITETHFDDSISEHSDDSALKASSQSIDIKARKSILRQKLADLNLQKSRYQRLADVAKPSALPEIKFHGNGAKSIIATSPEQSSSAQNIVSNSDSFLKETVVNEEPFVAEFEDDIEFKSEAVEKSQKDAPKIEAFVSISGRSEASSLQSSASSTRKRRHVHTRAPEVSEKQEAGVAVDDDDYVTWMPPKNQKGDGTTALNAKFAGKY